ncbi:pyrroline-5-carboxylate reductase [Lactiplantibacillus xiangfangensis]|uniref:Pyrroline-5-carboxylate reductase n=1 Tax=Lactiplantibacillus xiangfangensis TaxID=942150 RepID=A0A0R2M562_9LACO|nr:pyrroline-5-carboxylate reductase [Lactiplantibacillus xiangfangensis]KRO09214.1 pyrroline-5-carboxylate reductase [Lactiplantibacillus xiangfangensis]
MKIGFIGAGNMGRAIIDGWLKMKAVAPADIYVHSAHASSYEPYAKVNGLNAMESNLAVANAADVVVLAIKPNIALDTLKAVQPALTAGKWVITMVSGLSLADYATVAPDVPVLRIMPNVNVAIGAGMTALIGNAALSADQYAAGKKLFDAIGETSEVAEKDFSTFSALAGSSPAYVYFFIDAMARAGVKHGLSKAAATKIAAQATLGSAEMVLKSDKIPFDLIDQVSSPGGTTVAGLLAMEEAGFMTSVVKGIDATIAKELGE